MTVGRPGSSRGWAVAAAGLALAWSLLLAGTGAEAWFLEVPSARFPAALDLLFAAWFLRVGLLAFRLRCSLAVEVLSGGSLFLCTHLITGLGYLAGLTPLALVTVPLLMLVVLGGCRRELLGEGGSRLSA